MTKFRAISMAIIMALAILGFITACGSKGEQPNAMTGDLADLPDWVISPDIDDGVAAVGIAQKSVGGLQFQIPKAELDAKAKIAAKVQSEMSQVTKRALRESNVNGIDDVEDVFSQATKEVVTNMPLSGVKRQNIFQDSNGTLYIRMVLKNDDYSKYIQNSMKIYESRLNKANLGRENLNNAQNAVKIMFEELETERNKATAQ